ncbi:hypothetical protein FACS1894107_02960 [Planctomycetales bacterium]|nr:hypothetical protein FACS1894107_02960 [Planctomycetales bacterium]GHS96934.1 hypothetical protein FACS1894108_02470 [Planctomycetales bacterium]
MPTVLERDVVAPVAETRRVVPQILKAFDGEAPLLTHEEAENLRRDLSIFHPAWYADEKGAQWE